MEQVLKELIELIIQEEYKTKTGEEISFQVKKKKAFGIWKTHGEVYTITALIDNQPVGFIQIAIISKEPSFFDYLMHHGYLSRSGFKESLPIEKRIEFLDHAVGEWPYVCDQIDLKSQTKQELEKIEKNIIKRLKNKHFTKYEEFKDFYYNKPLVDNIEVNNELRRQRIGAALYEYAARWLAKKGLNLYASDLQTEAAEKTWKWLKRNRKARVGFDQETNRLFLSYL